MAQQEYQEEQYKAEMAYLWSRKALLVEYGKDSSEIQGQIYDKMIAEADRLTEASKEADKMPSLIIWPLLTKNISYNGLH